MAKRKARMRHRTRSGRYRLEQFRCATCGAELISGFVHMKGEFFCSGSHAGEFFTEPIGGARNARPRKRPYQWTGRFFSAWSRRDHGFRR
jgi:hypothetical protein